MSLATGIENFANLVLPGTAVAGVILAYFGLSTWQKQMRWEQGRGLAIRLFTGIEKTKRSIAECRKIQLPNYDERVAIEDRRKIYHDYFRRTEEALTALGVSLSEFEDSVAEADVIWAADYSEISNSLREIERWIQLSLRSGSMGIDPDYNEYQRNQSNLSYHETYHKIIHGVPDADFNISASFASARNNLRQAIRSRGLV